MKFLALLGIVLLAQAQHEFLAERNFICKTCQKVVVLIATGKDTSSLCRDGTGDIYTPVCKNVEKYHEKIVTMTKNQRVSPLVICRTFHMCPSIFSKGQDLKWDRPALNMTMINEINKNDKIGWVAGINKRWKGKTLNDVRQQLGGIVDKNHVYKLPPRKENLPASQQTSFDARTKWPDCADLIGGIRDQSACGSCWAFGSTEAYNDRKCVSSSGSFQTLLSTEDTATCCTEGSDGCNGGSPGGAWDWFTNTGVVTGGNYSDIGKTDTCQPYQLAPCAFHCVEKDFPACPANNYPTPQCLNTCGNTGYAVSYQNDKHIAQSSYQINSVSQMESDLQTYSSITCGFTVYADFPSYKSGVYVHTWGQALGGHIIKIIGWGVEGGQNYWMVANSWNYEWGLHGYFKILKGVNECGIEGMCVAGH